MKSDGTNDYQCGSSVNIASSSFTNFPCSPVNWVQYVSIRQTGQDGKGGNQWLLVCEVEVYYNETEDTGIGITKTTAPISKLDVTAAGGVVLCGSSKGDFSPTWKFPDGTDVPEQNSATIRQADGSSGYKELRLSPLMSTPTNGHYKCQYTANNIFKAKTVNLTFTVDCQVSSWSACSSSCGRGTRARTITQNKIGAGTDCPTPLSVDCVNTNCGLIDMKAISAVATHGPSATWQNSDGSIRLSASLAIDGTLNYEDCATTYRSTTPWLRVDLKTAYLIRSVETSFREDRGNGAFVRIGSDLTNDGNDNPLCGTVPSRNNGASIWTATITCSSLLWGRYINVQKISSSNGYLSVCELKASYELGVGILYDDSSVASGNVFVYGGDPLPLPVLCGVSPDSTNLNSLLTIQWKSGNSPIQALSSVSDVGHNNRTSLHIRKAPLIDTTYTCHYTWIDKVQEALQFNLSINVDCGWSPWSACSKSRTVDNPTRKHRGKDCVGSSTELCYMNVSTPNSPVDVEIISKTFESLFLTWKSPRNIIGVIRTYKLYYWRLDEAKSGISSVESILPSFNLTGLRAYSRYQINVTVINNADAFPESSPASIIDDTLIRAPERPPSVSNPLEEMVVDSKDGVVRFTAPFISDEEVPISYIKVFLYFRRRPVPSFVPPSASRNVEIWREVASYNYSHYNFVRNDLSVKISGQTSEKNDRYSVYFVAYVIDEKEGIHLESSSGPSTFYAKADIACDENDSEQVFGTSLFGSAGIAFLVLFVIVLIAFVALLAVLVRQRQIPEKAYTSSKMRGMITKYRSKRMANFRVILCLRKRRYPVRTVPRL